MLFIFHRNSFIRSAVFCTASMTWWLVASAQTQTPTAPSSANSSISLNAVLGPALEAHGCPALLQMATLSNGISATGSIVYHWADQDVPGSVTLKWDPQQGLVMTSTTSLGIRTIAATSGKQTITDERGQKTDLGAHNASRFLFAYAPALELLGAGADAGAQIKALGMVTLSSGTPADAISISKHWPSHGNDAANQQVIFYFDHGTHLLLQRDDYVELNARGEGRLTRSFAYSDFRSVHGVMFPFSISETVDGQPLNKLTLSSLQF